MTQSSRNKNIQPLRQPAHLSHATNRQHSPDDSASVLTCPARLRFALCTILLTALTTGCAEHKQYKNPDAAPRATVKPVFMLRDVDSIRIFHDPKDLDRKIFDSTDVKILFIGNSHTRKSPDLLAKLFKISQPQKSILIARSMGGFLSQHAKSQVTLDLIEFGKWDFIVLQAQKYSTTGKYTYPIDGALKLAKLGQNQGSKIILFPEWSRRGVPDEYLRINQIHAQIADQTGAQVAPIGQTWDAIAQQRTDLVLHHADGNHAADVGHFINACIFYSMMNDQPPQVDASRWKLESEIAALVREQLQAHQKKISKAD